MSEPYWIDPAAITFKISPVDGLVATQAGDWDQDRRHHFHETAKYRAIVQHYRDGLAWEQTDLFADAYARRLARNGHVGRCRTIEDLARDYDRRFDALVETFRCDGFALRDRRGKGHALPSFLIGRGGEVFIGNQGNHRLAIAQMLGLDRIAGRIVCKHPQSRR